MNYILVLKDLLKKKVIGEIPFDLISLFHVQIQEPKSRSTATTAFVFLGKIAECYYCKIFEKKIDDDLTVGVDERSTCGLSVTGDTKIYQCHVIKR